MPKPLVSGLGSWGHGRRRQQQAHYQRGAGFSTIPSPFLRQMAAGSPYWIGRTDTTGMTRWIHEVRSTGTALHKP